jgi:hypothetical protein
MPSGQHPDNSILHLLLRYRDELDDVARFLITADSVVEDGQPKKEDSLEEDEKKQAEEEAKQVAREINSVLKDVFRLTYHQKDASPDLTIGQHASGEPNKPLILFQEMKENFNKAFKNFPEIQDDEWNDLFRVAIEAAKNDYKGLNYAEEKVNRLLDVVALTCEPLRADDVAATLKLKNDSEEMQNLLNILRPFFKGNPHTDTLILYHTRLKKYILYDMDLWHRRTAALTHELFVEAFLPQEGDWKKINNWTELSETNWERLSSPHPAEPMSRYVKRYLVHHAYQSYITTPWRCPKARWRRAKNFLNLVCDPGYRTVRLAEVGQEAAVEDLWNGLRVIYTEYIHGLSAENNEKAMIAFNRLMAAKESSTDRHNKLIELERNLRRGKKNVGALWEFLELPYLPGVAFDCPSYAPPVSH